ncbi:hypothetical protein PIB30_014716 [Stylosanthes scabra]|uniref:Uncharacterized protein n=1 Tax=Stylosanthes scabra TaxID=79078 RepID=A0ABU6W598_9FABA|nr:hypothetical protein [Stylosanthes scabra]
MGVQLERFCQQVKCHRSLQPDLRIPSMRLRSFSLGVESWFNLGCEKIWGCNCVCVVVNVAKTINNLPSLILLLTLPCGRALEGARLSLAPKFDRLNVRSRGHGAWVHGEVRAHNSSSRVSRERAPLSSPRVVASRLSPRLHRRRVVACPPIAPPLLPSSCAVACRPSRLHFSPRLVQVRVVANRK